MTEIDILKSELNKYLEITDDKAAQVMGKHRSKADKLARDIERRLHQLKEDGAAFEEVVTAETNVMDRYCNKIYEQIQETTSNIERPEKITLQTLENFIKTTRDHLGGLDKVLIKYVKLIKGKKYARRVRTLDGAIKRLNGSIKNLEDFVTVDYTPSSEIEMPSVLIEETLELLDEFHANFQELLTKETEVLDKTDEIEDYKKQLDELINHPSKVALEKAVNNFETNQREIDFAFSNVRKVLRKYGKINSRSQNVDTALVSDLVTDAATTMGKMSSSSSLTNLLKDLKIALNEPSLNLNKDKRETAEADIDKLLAGDLETYYTRAHNITGEREKREKELKDLDLENKIEQLQTTIAGAERDRARIFQREYRRLEDLRESISKNVEDINDTIANLTAIEKRLEISLPELPEWVKSSE